jgi:hypothetical protein
MGIVGFNKLYCIFPPVQFLFYRTSHGWNTRLQNDMRLAVVLNSMVSENRVNNSGLPEGKSNRIELKVIYFPGSRSSLKEKPYFDDIVSKLLLKN